MVRVNTNVWQRPLAFLKNHPKLALGFGVAVQLLIVGYALGYVPLLSNRSVQFSYSGDTCFKDITVLPRLHRLRSSQDYSISTQKQLGVRDYPVVARQTCLRPLKAPQENTQHQLSYAPFGNALIKQRFKISFGALPHLSAKTLEGTISTKEPLTIEIDQTDKVFQYYLANNNKKGACTVSQNHISCDIQPLELAQGQQYAVSVQRFFGAQKVGDVINATITTVTPVQLVDSSIHTNEVVYAVPTEVHLVTDKSLESATAELELVTDTGGHQPVTHTTSLADKEIVLHLSAPLPRQARFEVTLKDAKAKDKGVLDKTYVLPFQTSGGPKVMNINLAKYAIDQGQSVTLTFDQDISTGQDISKFLTLKAGGTPVAYSVTIKGRLVTLKPTASLPFCTPLTVQLIDGVQSTYGVTGGSTWSYGSRTICHTVSTIGFSAQGRPIRAYRFGTGASKVMYLGSIHGNEKSTKALLESWMNDLEAGFDKMPAGRSIIIVPNINQDGYAANTRLNANGTDLNRNFPANSWKADITVPGGQLVTNGGGTTPLSEPESQAIAAFILSEKPRLVLSYHSAAAIVSGNDAADAPALALQYSKMSGYRNLLNDGESDSVFQYDTTGAMEDWLHDKVGIATILIELSSDKSTDYSRNIQAMWAMAQLP
jgi:protein MpaA